jgi:hypothetical protein
MRRIVLATLAFLLMASSLIATAATPPGDNTRVHTKGVILSGQVSSDGKTLRTDDDNDWSISNVDAIKGLQGRYVTVNCRIDANKRAIRVIFVVETAPTKHAASLGDSAFRR